MGALDTAVRQGKALYAGISSYPPAADARGGRDPPVDGHAAADPPAELLAARPLDRGRAARRPGGDGHRLHRLLAAGPGRAHRQVPRRHPGRVAGRARRLALGGGDHRRRPAPPSVRWARSPPSAARRSRRWRWPGCCAIRGSPPRWSARAASRSSRTTSPPCSGWSSTTRNWPASTGSCPAADRVAPPGRLPGRVPGRARRRRHGAHRRRARIAGSTRAAVARGAPPRRAGRARLLPRTGRAGAASRTAWTSPTSGSSASRARSSAAARQAGLEVLAETPMERCAAAAVEERGDGARPGGRAVHRSALAGAPAHGGDPPRGAGTGEQPDRQLAGGGRRRRAAAQGARHRRRADARSPLLHDLARPLPAAVTGTLSHPEFLEVTAAGVDKGHRPAAAARPHLGLRAGARRPPSATGPTTWGSSRRWASADRDGSGADARPGARPAG